MNMVVKEKQEYMDELGLKLAHYHSPAKALECLLVFGNANRKIRKHMDTAVAFTQEYSKVSISMGNAKCTNQGSRSSKDKER